MKRQELVKELKSREQMGEENLMIFNEKIVVRRQRADPTIDHRERTGLATMTPNSVVFVAKDQQKMN